MVSAYLRLLLFLLTILILAFDSSSPAFHMMYSAYKLNKQGDNIQPCLTPFPILNKSIVPCPVLTVVSWLAYRFLRRQVRWSGIPISVGVFHSLLWSTQSELLNVKERDSHKWSHVTYHQAVHRRSVLTGVPARGTLKKGRAGLVLEVEMSWAGRWKIIRTDLESWYSVCFDWFWISRRKGIDVQGIMGRGYSDLRELRV